MKKLTLLCLALPLLAADPTPTPTTSHGIFIGNTTTMADITFTETDCLTFSCGISINLKTGEVDTHGLKITDASKEFWNAVQSGFQHSELEEQRKKIEDQRQLIDKMLCSIKAAYDDLHPAKP